ncbi:MAG: NAD(P)-dependent dehydrogenase (short-subunit alcohol dehydrogenase family) [Limisphaerales bacterium]|jgi:NAD(P)-dependent dehydrogenase (short-subunit alcohol dehydrogenase family)
MDLKDKVVIVTGGASGIGKATCEAMARLGARVAVVDLNADGAGQVAADIGGLAVSCDVGQEASVNDMVAEVRDNLGEVDVLFNNAGVATGGNPLDTPIEVWQSQWEINVMAHVYAVRAVLPSMLERQSGYILHTASMAGILTTHGNLTYAATKHAVVGIAEWMAITYHDKGIRTSLLAPLGVRTPMLGNVDADTNEVLGPIKEPEEVAQQVIDAIAEERFLILTDELAQTWMDRKNTDLDRWLGGMRRVQSRLEGE